MTDPDHLPAGYAVDLLDPDSFVVGCTSCGHLDTCRSRSLAHLMADNHGLGCSQTGVSPVSEVRVATDGGDR